MKQKIYYFRTYRRLKATGLYVVLLALLLIVPCSILLLCNLEPITKCISLFVAEVLNNSLKSVPLNLKTTQFSIFGNIWYIDTVTTFPDIATSFINVIIVSLISIFLCTSRRKGKPLAIFLMLSFITHMINCLYFVFATNFFPYSIADYSILYVKQQLGIWLAFIVITALVVSLMGRRGTGIKVATFLATMLYSVVFGIIRYIVFMYILIRYSVLYMAIMFFVMGPIFDFLYLVGIYSIFINIMIKIYFTEKGREEWLWP